MRHVKQEIQDKPETEMWLSYNGIPLKWHLPIGVIMDLYNDNNEFQLPWNIVVHFHNFPSQIIMQCPNK